MSEQGADEEHESEGAGAPAPPGSAPLSAAQAFALTLLAGAASLGVVLLAALLETFDGAGPFAERLLAGLASVRHEVVVLTLAQAGGLGVAIVVGRAWLANARAVTLEAHADPPEITALSEEGWLPPSSAALVLSGLAGLGLHPVLAQLVAALRTVLGEGGESGTFEALMLQPEGLLQGFLVVGALLVVAPLSEEWLFRGIILPGLVDAHGVLTGLVGSALLFGAIHGSWVGVAYGGAAGLVLGALRLRTGSLWAPVALHAASNALPLLIPARLAPIPGLNVPGAAGQLLPLPLVIGGAILAIVALGALALVDDDE